MTKQTKKKTKKKSTKTKPRTKATTRVKPAKATAAQKKAAKKAKAISKNIKPKKPVTKRPGKVGRPTILTPELIEKISKLMMTGAYIETACAVCGFHRSLYNEWLKMGRKRRQLQDAMHELETAEEQESIQDDIDKIDPIYQQFTDAIEKAVNDAELRDIMRIDQAAGRSWQAAAWKLERKHPERWARRDRIEHSGKVETGQPIEKIRENVLALMKDPEAMEMAEALMTRLRSSKEEE